MSSCVILKFYLNFWYSRRMYSFSRWAFFISLLMPNLTPSAAYLTLTFLLLCNCLNESVLSKHCDEIAFFNYFNFHNKKH